MNSLTIARFTRVATVMGVCVLAGCASESDSRLLLGSLLGGAYPNNAGAQFVGSAMVANANSMASQPQVTVNNNNIHGSTANNATLRTVSNETLSDGSTYTGTMILTADGLWRPHRGTYTWPNGQKYVGEFKDSKRNGQGTLTFNGASYVGEFKDDKGHGQGTETSPNGETYVGEFKDGQRSGQGTRTQPNGEQYVGEWKDGKMNGQGTNTWPDGQKYVGEWKDGQQSGQGSWTQPNGAQYVGEWKDGKMDGLGKMTYADGKVEEGLWKQNQFTGQQMATSSGTDKTQTTKQSDKQGSLTVGTDANDCEVFVDGKFMGNTPAKLKLAEGEHTIEVKKTGFKPYKKEITVSEGSELTLRPTLEKEERGGGVELL